MTRRSWTAGDYRNIVGSSSPPRLGTRGVSRVAGLLQQLRVPPPAIPQ
jgi:hypothetical protein